MINRELFTMEHNVFRNAVRRFVLEELVPHSPTWETAGVVPKDIWRKAGGAGLLCPGVDEAYGGYGADFLYNVVVIEEMSRAGLTAPGFYTHTEMVAPYIEKYGSVQMKEAWLPGMVSGEVIGAIAITEPGAGSDMRGVKTRAEKRGNEYVIRGNKTYISNGWNSDFFLVVAKTDASRPRDAISILLVEADRKGVSRGARLQKLGYRGQDTCEIFFDEVVVPATNLIGEEHEGMRCLTSNLARERLAQAIRAAAVIESTLEQTVDYVSTRQAFGKRISDFQNTQFKLAEIRAAAVMARVFVDRCIGLQMQHALDPIDAAIAKLQLAELQCKTTDECLQLHGGAGYMWEFPVCRAFADARLAKIAGGTVEIMKQIIGRDLIGPKR